MLTAPRFWYQPPTLRAHLLRPFSWLYQTGAMMHKLLYRCGIKKKVHFPLPVIVVGNLSVGGVGKTPFVIWLANQLKSQGYKPGLVSRGYGGQTQQPRHVTVESDPKQVGDEAILLVKKTQCPLVVAAKRVQAVEQLLASNDCDVVISDDGLQHYALIRDIEIVVVDAQRQWGNGFCLPAGPLRERKQRLKSVDLVIYNGEAGTDDDYFKMTIAQARSIAQPEKIISLSAFAGQSIHAVAGIGHPQRFFQQLSDYGIHVIPHIFPDHYRYQADDLNFHDQLPILMTEKDAVKCTAFATAQYWSVPLEIHVSPTFQNKLHQLISPTRR